MVGDVGGNFPSGDAAVSLSVNQDSNTDLTLTATDICSASGGCLSNYDLSDYTNSVADSAYKFFGDKFQLKVTL